MEVIDASKANLCSWVHLCDNPIIISYNIICVVALARGNRICVVSVEGDVCSDEDLDRLLINDVVNDAIFESTFAGICII